MIASTGAPPPNTHTHMYGTSAWSTASCVRSYRSSVAVHRATEPVNPVDDILPVEELNVFIALPPLSTKELTNAEQFNVLKWWKDRNSIYPLLSAVAKKLFSILASASSSESPFSTTGNIVTALRSTIAPQNVDMVLFLHANTPSNFDHIEKEGLVR